MPGGFSKRNLKDKPGKRGISTLPARSKNILEVGLQYQMLRYTLPNRSIRNRLLLLGIIIGTLPIVRHDVSDLQGCNEVLYAFVVAGIISWNSGPVRQFSHCAAIPATTTTPNRGTEPLSDHSRTVAAPYFADRNRVRTSCHASRYTKGCSVGSRDRKSVV